MKQFADLVPVIVFFAVYVATHNLITATSALMAATVVQLAALWLINKKIEKSMLYTAAVILVLGGLTVVFKDQTFIKWKPTVVNWAFAIVFLGSQWIGDQPLVKKMLTALMEKSGSGRIEANEQSWRRLNAVWAAFFAVLGGLNLIVAYHFDEETWVNFKLFGLISLNLLFFAAHIPWFNRHLIGDDSTA